MTTGYEAQGCVPLAVAMTLLAARGSVAMTMLMTEVCGFVVLVAVTIVECVVAMTVAVCENEKQDLLELVAVTTYD